MNAFDLALFMAPGRVCGFKLKPFSPYQLALMKFLESPFVTEGVEIDWRDCALALLVCRSRREDGLRLVNRFAGSPLYRLYFWARIKAAGWVKVARDMQRHIAEYHKYPETWQATAIGQAATTNSGAPTEWFIVALIAQETSIDPALIWDMSLIDLCCHKAIFDERNGGSEIAEEIIRERQANG